MRRIPLLAAVMAARNCDTSFSIDSMDAGELFMVRCRSDGSGDDDGLMGDRELRRDGRTC